MHLLYNDFLHIKLKEFKIMVIRALVFLAQCALYTAMCHQAQHSFWSQVRRHQNNGGCKQPLEQFRHSKVVFIRSVFNTVSR